MYEIEAGLEGLEGLSDSARACDERSSEREDWWWVGAVAEEAS